LFDIGGFMKKYTKLGSLLFLLGLFVALLMFHHLLRKFDLHDQFNGHVVMMLIGLCIACFGAGIYNYRHEQRYDHIQRAKVIREGGPEPIVYVNNFPELCYEGIQLQALKFIHMNPNKSANALFNQHFADVILLAESIPENLGTEYIRELKRCLRSYV